MGLGRLSNELGVNFLKDDPELDSIALELSDRLPELAHATLNQRAIAEVYARIGGLLRHLAQLASVDVAAVLAVWFAESGSAPFTPKRPVIRLEVNELFELWGKRDRQVFDGHFRFGGRNQQPGHPWENHEYRTQDTGIYYSVHHNQKSEYAALTLAQIIAGDESAFCCTNVGGPQLMMSSHRFLGYDSARDMYEAFQQSERCHVLSFFDYCILKAAPKQGDLLNYLRIRDWNNFAKHYNASGQASAYVSRLRTGYEAARAVLNLSRSA